MKEFKDKVALITGGANGIGKAFAIEAAKRGMKIALVDIDGPDLVGTAAVLKALGAHVEIIETDVTDYDEVKKSVESTMNAFGQIDLLFNNAGIAPAGDLVELPVLDWQWAVQANLVSHGYYYREVLPIMEKQGTPAHILATASTAGVIPGFGSNPAYSATKHGALALAEDLKVYMDVHDLDIGVSVYCPGFVQTDIHHSMRHRPARFTNSDDPWYSSDAFRARLERTNVNISTGIPIDTVGPRLFEAIEKNDLYIFTHPEYTPLVTLRHRAIERDGEAYDGLGIETDRSFDGQVALITGAASGFGKAFAREAFHRGMKLSLVDIQEEKLKEYAHELESEGAEVIALPADVSLPEDVKATVDKTMEHYGQIDVLFANAGVATKGDESHLRPRDWDWAASANLLSHAYYYREVLPIMIKQGTPANIMSTASIAGIIPGFAKVPTYAATKHALVALVESAVSYLKDHKVDNVKMSVYCPGFVQTNLHHSDEYRPERFAMGDDPYYTSDYYQGASRDLEHLIVTGTELAPVAKRLFKALEEGQLYVLTHPKHRKQFAARHRAIEAFLPDSNK
ncbi:MAG: SDR family NAD(P)-dependent oxidoreductase [Actinomycetaceae bacterium]|nr:SDR family NAD(P)-dependent oxidoreductase [Arcanobacterium sp.]MDD7686558.1 SDR family NAD(P)-dependent oxidoreductase [Actinomycetaceae bacterium]MDY5272838.1 SDR family NAD(P)-dependent oxidoreductase [Arcanobacterium sp.]